MDTSSVLCQDENCSLRACACARVKLHVLSKVVGGILLPQTHCFDQFGTCFDHVDTIWHGKHPNGSTSGIVTLSHFFLQFRALMFEEGARMKIFQRHIITATSNTHSRTTPWTSRQLLHISTNMCQSCQCRTSGACLQAFVTLNSLVRMGWNLASSWRLLKRFCLAVG